MGMKPRIEPQPVQPIPPFPLLAAYACGDKYPCLCPACRRASFATGVFRDDAQRAAWLQCRRADLELANTQAERRYSDPGPANRRALALLLSLMTLAQRETWDAARVFWTYGSDRRWWLLGIQDSAYVAQAYRADGLREPSPTHITVRYVKNGALQSACILDGLVAKKLAVENDAASLAKVVCGYSWDARGVVASR